MGWSCKTVLLFLVIMKQEHRDEVDLSAVPSLALPHAGSVQGLHSMRTQLP